MTKIKPRKIGALLFLRKLKANNISKNQAIDNSWDVFFVRNHSSITDETRIKRKKCYKRYIEKNEFRTKFFFFDVRAFISLAVYVNVFRTT